MILKYWKKIHVQHLWYLSNLSLKHLLQVVSQYKKIIFLNVKWNLITHWFTLNNLLTCEDSILQIIIRPILKEIVVNKSSIGSEAQVYYLSIKLPTASLLFPTRSSLKHLMLYCPHSLIKSSHIEPEFSHDSVSVQMLTSKWSRRKDDMWSYLLTVVNWPLDFEQTNRSLLDDILLDRILTLVFRHPLGLRRLAFYILCACNCLKT